MALTAISPGLPNRESAKARSALPCIHIGLPKTATTTLQRYLFSRHSEIQYIGKFRSNGEFGNYPFPAAKKLNQHLLGIRKTYGARKALRLIPRLSQREINELKSYVDAGMDAGKISVYSQEAISELPHEKTEKFAEVLQSIFGDCRLLLTIREPLSFVKSQYFQMLKSHNLASGRELKKYVGRSPRYFDVNEWVMLSYEHRAHSLRHMLKVGEIARTYANSFGKDRVKVLVFEQLKNDAEGFYRDLVNFLEINADEAYALSQNQSTNIRWSEDPINRIKHLEQTTFSKLKYRLCSKRGRTKMLGLEGLVDPSSGPRMSPQFLPEVKEKILQIGREQTQILESDWGLSLSEYGYPT